jgi:hypothetical protein
MWCTAETRALPAVPAVPARLKSHSLPCTMQQPVSMRQPLGQPQPQLLHLGRQAAAVSSPSRSHYAALTAQLEATAVPQSKLGAMQTPQLTPSLACGLEQRKRRVYGRPPYTDGRFKSAGVFGCAMPMTPPGAYAEGSAAEQNRQERARCQMEGCAPSLGPETTAGGAGVAAATAATAESSEAQGLVSGALRRRTISSTLHY